MVRRGDLVWRLALAVEHTLHTRCDSNEAAGGFGGWRHTAPAAKGGSALPHPALPSPLLPAQPLTHLSYMPWSSWMGEPLFQCSR
jgi:hypothetical protein